MLGRGGRGAFQVGLRKQEVVLPRQTKSIQMVEVVDKGIVGCCGMEEYESKVGEGVVFGFKV